MMELAGNDGSLKMGPRGRMRIWSISLSRLTKSKPPVIDDDASCSATQIIKLQ